MRAAAAATTAEPPTRSTCVPGINAARPHEMSWLRIDDQFAENDKILDLGDRAFRLHMVALCYCARNLCDGILCNRQVDIVCAVIGAKRPLRYIDELVRAELWVPIAGGGYELHDYLEYNPSAAAVKAKRDARRSAGKRGADSRWHSKSDGKPDGKSHGQPHMPPDPDPSPKNPYRPVGEIHDLERLKAASRLYEAIPETGRDEGTHQVVLGYASQLPVETFDEIRASLLAKLEKDGLFKSAGAYVNGALQKAVRKQAA